MAADDDQEQKTEQPSDRRLAAAFEQGDIPLSRDTVSTGAFMLGVVVLGALAPTLEHRLVRMVTDTLTLAPTTPFSSIPSIVLPIALPLLGVLVAMAVGGLVFTFLQTQGHVWDEKAMPDLSRVFSTERLTRLVSKDFAIDLGVGTVKLVAILVACWGVVRGEFLTLGRLGHSAPGEQLGSLYAGLSKIGLRAVTLLILFAGADFALTRWRYRKRHMMTKEELKREMREDEGDPQMKHARKRRHRELAKKNAMSETRRADALIVNPTHIAIAIRYRKDEGAAPMVLAKGKGVLAESMREIARSNGIPIVQDIPLARLLYKKVKVGGQVPAATYKAVAAVLAFVYRMTHRPVAPTASSEARP